MNSSSEFFDSDLLHLMTATLDAVVAASPTSHGDIDAVRFAAAKHILAAIGAGERDGQSLEHATLAFIQARFVVSSPVSDAVRLPSVHRSSA